MSLPSHASASPLVRLVVALLLVSPLALAIPHLGTSEAERAAASTPLPVTTAPAAPTTRDASGLPSPLLGFAINAHHIGDLPRYLQSVDAIHELGANSLIVVTPMYQRRVDSTKIRTIRAKCPTDEQLLAILGRAKQHGMSTVLMPILLIEKPGTDDWRGVIRPPDWDAWWRGYVRSLDRFVTIARDANVDVLSVGSELNTTEDQVDRWRAIIERVRSRFGGRITYSSNWDRYDQVTFWPLVDIISVSAYFELERDTYGAPEPALVKAWAPIRARLVETARRWERPLLLSELGYPSLPWANAHPWNYVAGGDTVADHAAQARSWRAFFDAWSDTIADPNSGILGVCGYRWDPYHQGDAADTGYGLVGKPAHAVVRGGFDRIRTAAAGHADP